MTAPPEPATRLLKGWRDRVDAWRTVTNAQTLVDLRQTLEQLRAVGRRLRLLDDPWLLLLTVPALIGLRAIGASIAGDMLLAAAVMLAGRRWRIGVIVPMLMLCLLQLVRFPWLPDFGDVGMIPVLMIAARIGYDPGFPAALQRCTTLGRNDYVVLGALALVSSCRVRAFLPAFELYAGSSALLALVMFLLGTSRVPARILFVLAAGFAAHVVLAPFGRTGPFVGWDLGVWLFDVVNGIVLFHAGRAIRQGEPVPGRGYHAITAAIVLIWALDVAVGMIELQLHYPAFRPAANGVGVVSYDETIGSALTATGLALLAWIRIRPALRALTVRALGNAIIAVAIAIPALVVAVAAMRPYDVWFPLSTTPGDVRVLIYLASRTPNVFVNAIALLSLCAGTILLFERWPQRIAPPAPRVAGSFMATLLGRLFAGVVAGGALVVAGTAVALTAIGPLPSLEELAAGRLDPAEINMEDMNVSGNDAIPIDPGGAATNDAGGAGNSAY